MTMLNVKAPKVAPTPPESVVQLEHASVKFPKLMPDGMPTLALGSATNPSVAATPEDWLKLRLPLLLNPVPAAPVAVVLKVMVAALALAARLKIATPKIDAAWTRRPSFIFLISFIVLVVAHSHVRADADINAVFHPKERRVVPLW